MSPTDLPPFDEDATCPKCGHDDVAVIYEANTHYRICEQHNAPTLTQPACCRYEHFHRVCQRCRYLWAEACIPEETDA